MALRPIELKTQLFVQRGGGLSDAELERSRRAITWGMFGLCQINREWFETYPNTPGLYETGILYKLEPSSEIWQDVPTTLLRGYGDCEDLACYRIGELQAQGIAAMPYITWREKRDHTGTIYHALVRHPNGLIEDPSRALGMRGHPVVRRPVFIDVDPHDYF